MQSPIISPGEADILLGFEALEAFRPLNRGHGRRLVIANTAGAFRLGVEAAQDSRNWCCRPPGLTLSGKSSHSLAA